MIRQCFLLCVIEILTKNEFDLMNRSFMAYEKSRTVRSKKIKNNNKKKRRRPRQLEM